jgi:hypothetical protein
MEFAFSFILCRISSVADPYRYCLCRIPDPIFLHPGSRIRAPGFEPSLSLVLDPRSGSRPHFKTKPKKKIHLRISIPGLIDQRTKINKTKTKHMTRVVYITFRIRLLASYPSLFPDPGTRALTKPPDLAPLVLDPDPQTPYCAGLN